AAAMGEVGREVDLAAVGGDAVAVGEPGVADGDGAGAAGATSGGVREAAHGAAAAAVAGVAGHVDLAAVPRQAVAVAEPGGAAGDGAGAEAAHRRGVRQHAREAAGAAVARVADQVDLAAVADDAVAVGPARHATDDAAGAHHAHR